MEKIRTRFAPSPTGYMHIGNLRTALFEYLIAKHEDGDFLLRIEDTDQGRKVDGAVDVIYDTMKTCGLLWDEGPDIGGDFGPYVQSERLGMYKGYAEQLIELGGAHYCFCTECELEALRKEAGDSFKFVDPCKNLSKKEVQMKLDAKTPYVIRQTIENVEMTSYYDEVYGQIDVDAKDLEEQVLIKSDGFPTYNFANIIDDHTMNITHVVRGNEYLSSTPKYNLVYDAYGWKRPTYVHVPPVMKDEQHKLSKRNGDASFQDLVAKGYLPEAIMNYIALLGWSPETEQEIYSLEELIKVFNVKRISKSPAIFDIEKLTWMNGEYIKALDPEVYFEMVKPIIEEIITKPYDLKEIASLTQSRIKRIAKEEIEPLIDFFEELPEYDLEMYKHKKMKTTKENSIEPLKEAYKALEALEDWSDAQAIQDALMELPAKMELKNGRILWPVRTAVSGKQFTPGGAMEIGHILGKEETLRRIQIGIERLEKEIEE
ncbi:MAG: glutamate--tRNA ligase [Bacillota bacterium]|nr:glutamate--tRNA ligase [Bacillota bacterium]